LRILFCNYEYPPLGGGGGVINAAIAEELAQRHDVTVLTSHAFNLPRDSVERGVRVLRVHVLLRRQKAAAGFASMLSYVMFAPRVGKRLLHGARFDVINTHFVLPTGPVGDRLARQARIPNVLTVHGGDLFDPSKLSSPHRHWLLRRLVRGLALRAECVVGGSANTIDNLHEYYGNDIPARMIPLGIATPPPDVAGSRATLGFTEDDVLLVTVGRLIARKANDRLIDCVAQLDDPRVKLLVVGSGPLSDALRSHATRRGVAEQVKFFGFVDERQKFEILASSDLYVSTSLHEGFGLVYIEAMACGLPIVCYDFGGQTDFLESGVTGYLAHRDDLAGFVGACRRLIDDEQLRARMSGENVRRAKDFSVAACAGRYERLFEEMIERFPRQRP
jgi:glycosyltransferase involved in cell wall biosynthesis